MLCHILRDIISYIGCDIVRQWIESMFGLYSVEHSWICSCNDARFTFVQKKNDVRKDTKECCSFCVLHNLRFLSHQISFFNHMFCLSALIRHRCVMNVAMLAGIAEMRRWTQASGAFCWLLKMIRAFEAFWIVKIKLKDPDPEQIDIWLSRPSQIHVSWRRYKMNTLLSFVVRFSVKA